MPWRDKKQDFILLKRQPQKQALTMMKHVRVAIALRLQVGVDLNAANAT
jgi:hypothetical protein